MTIQPQAERINDFFEIFPGLDEIFFESVVERFRQKFDVLVVVEGLIDFLVSNFDNLST